ncbi:hypothetical protein KCP75_21895 [Salmonella enterica subsp. enterica]|nr:hypothetical protein KCP75_21895 [Salmonella enterica subsp. enterica]
MKLIAVSRSPRYKILVHDAAASQRAFSQFLNRHCRAIPQHFAKGEAASNPEVIARNA